MNIFDIKVNFMWREIIIVHSKNYRRFIEKAPVLRCKPAEIDPEERFGKFRLRVRNKSFVDSKQTAPLAWRALAGRLAIFLNFLREIQ